MNKKKNKDDILLVVEELNAAIKKLT